jgi:hypothetical protein
MNGGERRGKQLGEFFLRLPEEKGLLEDYVADPPGVLRRNDLDRYAEMIESGDVSGIYEDLRSAYPSSIIVGTIIIRKAV